MITVNYIVIQHLYYTAFVLNNKDETILARYGKEMEGIILAMVMEKGNK